MKLLLVRHAIALDSNTPGVSDHLRPLTEEGVSKFKKTARGLGQLVTAELVLTSTRLRAKQTAEILVRQWPGVPMQECEPLHTGSREQFEGAIARLPKMSLIAAVGHEPHFSEWTAAWLGAPRAEALEFKKGGAALIEFSGEVAKDTGRLVFFVSPKVVKDLSA